MADWEFGKIRKLREGTDVCILSYVPIMKQAFEVAERFEAAGKTAAVVSVHTLKPLDREGLALVLQNYRQVVVIEECAPNGSLSMQTKALAWETQARCQLTTFTLRDAFVHCYGSHEELLAEHGLSAAKICGRLGLSTS